MALGGLRPLRVGEILDAAIKIYTKKASTLFRIVVFVVAPLQVVSTLISLSITPDFGGTIGTSRLTFGNNGPAPPPAAPSGREIGAYAAGVLTIAILGWLVTLLTTGACYKAVADTYLGKETDWRTSLKFALGRFGALVWVSFLTIILIGLGVIACFFPGVWLYVSWLFCTVIVLTENRRGFKAMGRSFDLVKGRWWKTFWTFVVGFLFTAIVRGIIRTLFGALLLSTEPSNTVVIVVAHAIDLVAQVITVPFLAAFIAVMYFDLRVRKEAFDLELLAGQIGVDPASIGASEHPRFAPAPTAQPPYWPPPPGWTPPPADDQPTSRDPEEQPPYWPPPPGWRPGGGGGSDTS